MVTATDSHPASLSIRILRQDAPGKQPRWERHQIPYEPNLNIISVLQKIAAQATTEEGKKTTPVAWDCNCLEEVCGACTMLVNGRTRQACSTLVDRIRDDQHGEIELRPMSKFPVLRDLCVDRGRMFRTLEKVKAWVPVDDYSDRGPGPRESPESQEMRYPLSECMTCGCCVEACPNVNDGSPFMGPQVISQVRLFNMHPSGKMHANERLDAIMGEGGIADCGKAQNCVQVCPKEIPLTESISVVGRDTMKRALFGWLLK